MHVLRFYSTNDIDALMITSQFYFLHAATTKLYWCYKHNGVHQGCLLQA